MLEKLTKEQKKASRILIDLALERECAELIRRVSKLVGKPLGDVEKPNHARYIEIFNEIYSFDKRLAARYDGITGGRYFDTVSYLLSEGILNEEDLEICDGTMKDELVRIKEIFSRL